MAMDFTGKTVGITGANSLQGIGFAIAKRFLQLGARVMIAGRREEALAAAKQALDEYGTVSYFCGDCASESAVAAMFDKIEEEFGQIDIFVSNAGIYPQKFVCDMTAEEWDQVMNVNLRSVFLCAKECSKRMKNGGVLLNAASYASVLGSAGSGAYAASKAAIQSLTKVLAAELAPKGIRVNGYIPGVIATQMTQPVIDAKGDELVNAIALHRLGTSEDVAKAVTFLASEDASYITGTFIEISGGKLCVQNPDYPWRVM